MTDKALEQVLIEKIGQQDFDLLMTTQNGTRGNIGENILAAMKEIAGRTVSSNEDLESQAEKMYPYNFSQDPQSHFNQCQKTKRETWVHDKKLLAASSTISEGQGEEYKKTMTENELLKVLKENLPDDYFWKNQLGDIPISKLYAVLSPYLKKKSQLSEGTKHDTTTATDLLIKVSNWHEKNYIPAWDDKHSTFMNIVKEIDEYLYPNPLNGKLSERTKEFDPEKPNEYYYSNTQAAKRDPYNEFSEGTAKGGETKTPLEQEEFNHLNTRIAWDRTCEERDNLKDQVKVMGAIKRGLETSLTEALKEIEQLKSGQEAKAIAEKAMEWAEDAIMEIADIDLRNCLESAEYNKRKAEYLSRFSSPSSPVKE